MHLRTIDRDGRARFAFLAYDQGLEHGPEDFRGNPEALTPRDFIASSMASSKKSDTEAASRIDMLLTSSLVVSKGRALSTFGSEDNGLQTSASSSRACECQTAAPRGPGEQFRSLRPRRCLLTTDRGRLCCAPLPLALDLSEC